MLVDNTGIYTVNESRVDLNNAQVRDYDFTASPSTAGVINHIDYLLPRFQPDELQVGFGLWDSYTGDLSYTVYNINIRADVGIDNTGEHAY